MGQGSVTNYQNSKLTKDFITENFEWFNEISRNLMIIETNAEKFQIGTLWLKLETLDGEVLAQRVRVRGTLRGRKEKLNTYAAGLEATVLHCGQKCKNSKISKILNHLNYIIKI